MFCINLFCALKYLYNQLLIFNTPINRGRLSGVVPWIPHFTMDVTMDIGIGRHRRRSINKIQSTG